MRRIEEKVNLIFPMAGKEAHSGFKFRPFLKIGEETLIEAAVKPFLNWQDQIHTFYFVCLAEHELTYGISNWFREKYKDLNYELIVIENPTAGPAQTIIESVKLGYIKGPAIVCDTDHSLNVDPLFEEISAGGDCFGIIPVWNLKGEDLKVWSVAAIDDNTFISAISEKELPKIHGNFKGVIGCYYFSDIEVVCQICRDNNYAYFSKAISFLVDTQNLKFKAVTINEAEFYGDARRLREMNQKRKKYFGTIFCDIDGTLVEHEDEPNYDLPLKVLPGSKEKLNEWIENGYYIILVTARKINNLELLKQSLKNSDFTYHEIIANLPSGPRYLINDRKPSAILTSQVNSYEIDRNAGISHINLPNAIQPNILKRFKGGSFAETLLVEDDEKIFIRKRVSKKENLSLGYGKLKTQFNTLEKFSKLNKTIIPAIWGENDNFYEYFYDLEFLPEHKLLSECKGAEKHEALERLLGILKSSIYSHFAEDTANKENWLLNHLSSKIFAKLDQLQQNPKFNTLINNEEIIINNKTYRGLRRLLTEIILPENLSIFSPQKFTSVHGDLTFENVLVKNHDIKLIDMDGADFFDAPELDLGKMFQSALSGYESWAHSDEKLIEQFEDSEITIKFRHNIAEEEILKNILVKNWALILGCSEELIEKKALFYMGLHLIRMVPFRLKVSEEQGLYAMINAIHWIDTTINIKGRS